MTLYSEIMCEVGLQGGTGRGCACRMEVTAIGANSFATGTVPRHRDSVTFSVKLLKWSLDMFWPPKQSAFLTPVHGFGVQMGHVSLPKDSCPASGHLVLRGGRVS